MGERGEKGQCSGRLQNFPCKLMLSFYRILKFVQIFLFLLRREIFKNPQQVVISFFIPSKVFQVKFSPSRLEMKKRKSIQV